MSDLSLYNEFCTGLLCMKLRSHSDCSSLEHYGFDNDNLAMYCTVLTFVDTHSQIAICPQKAGVLSTEELYIRYTDVKY